MTLAILLFWLMSIVIAAYVSYRVTKWYFNGKLDAMEQLVGAYVKLLENQLRIDALDKSSPLFGEGLSVLMRERDVLYVELKRKAEKFNKY